HVLPSGYLLVAKLSLSRAKLRDGGVARDARKAGTAFRRVRPLTAVRRPRADRMTTGAPNECRLKGGPRKHLHNHAERIVPQIR
ncbi:MAG: hypothetical protein IJC66_13835, partial [Kiritimatiellae bacterium]|nr:hypothetical protein [Kiritimatiellia bacterium]